MSQTVDIKMGDWISRGFNRVTSNWQSWALISLVALLIMGASALCLVIPILLITGPLQHSLYYIFHKQQKGEAILVGDLAYGFQNRFWDFCVVFLMMAGAGLAAYLIGAALVFGFAFISTALEQPLFAMIGVFFLVICVIAALVLMGYLMPRIAFLIPHMYHTGLQWRQAYTEVDAVVKQKFWMFFLFVFLVNILSSIGTYACYIGYLFTFPLNITIIGEAYQDLFTSPTMPGNNLDTDKTVVVSPE